MVIGGLAFGIDVGLFSVLHVALHSAVLTGNIISTSAAVVFSFTANAFITFGVSDRLVRRFAGFVAVAACGFLISSGLLWVFALHLDVPAIAVKVGSVPVVFTVQFLLNSRLTFAIGEFSNRGDRSAPA